MSESVGTGWDVPAGVKDRCEFHWFHVQRDGCLVVVILSSAPAWYVGHFDKGRMRRCDGHECRMCAAGSGRQLRYVLAAVDYQTRQNGVIEVSKSVAELIRSWSARGGGLRGMTVQFEKPGKSKHCRLEVTYIDRPPPGWAAEVQPVDVVEALSSTWDRQVA